MLVIVIHVRYFVYGLAIFLLLVWAYRRWGVGAVREGEQDTLDTAKQSAYDFVTSLRHKCDNEEKNIPRSEFDQKARERLFLESKGLLRAFTRYCEQCKYIRLEKGGKVVHLRRTPRRR